MFKKTITILVLILVALVATLFFFFKASNSKTVLINNHKVFVEIANTKTKRALGLSSRDKLMPNAGMLFVFGRSSRYSFWMKGMKFPLDIIWIRDSKIVDFVENAPVPLKFSRDQDLLIYQPKSDVNYVLEVNAGWIKENNIKINNEVEIKK